MKHTTHISVLRDEAIALLNPQSNQNFIDATIGGGGHTEKILEATKPHGKVLGIDWNMAAIRGLRSEYGAEITRGNLELVCDNFSNIAEITGRTKFERASGIIFDLGISSDELAQSGRGFSFLKDEPLVMTFAEAPEPGQMTAQDVVNSFDAEKLAEIFKTYGEERLAARAAQAIVSRRSRGEIKTSQELAELISRAFPVSYEHGRIHPATRVFQALRIYVNDELGNLERALVDALEVVDHKGRIVVITFHSLEDRIVKRRFIEFTRSGKALLLTKKPIVPSEEEVKANPRSRSAKLRAIEKV